MASYGFERTGIEGVRIISAPVFEDNRGSFCKSFIASSYRDEGIIFNDAEHYISRSKRNTIRGMHFQIHNPQAKLVTVVSGSIYDVVIDLRSGSETFGKWEGFSLDSNEGLSIYIPRGFAHGFLALEDGTTILCCCDTDYDRETDTGISFCDPDIGIEWPIDVDSNLLVVSEKDRSLMSFSDYCNLPQKM